MKLRVLIVMAVFAVLFLITGILYAANGDLIVNGNLGVGTPTPAGKAEVNGNLIVDGNLGVGTTTPAGKADINGNMIVNGNLTVSGTITAPNTHVMAKYYQSPEQTITSAGSLTLAHGLGVEPVLIQVILVCKTASAGYSVGDHVVAANVAAMDSQGWPQGVAIIPNATNLYIRFGAMVPNVFTL